MVQKTGQHIARDLRTIAAVKDDNGPPLWKMVQACLAGKELDEPIPGEFAKAARVLTQILAPAD